MVRAHDPPETFPSPTRVRTCVTFVTRVTVQNLVHVG